MNKLFIIERGNYGELGQLFITVTAIGLLIPVFTVIITNIWIDRAVEPPAPAIEQ